MKFSVLALPLAAAGIQVASALRFTNANFYNITVGKPFNITWADAVGPVTLTLAKGATSAYITTVETLASDLSASHYLWTPSSSLLRDIYDIVFKDSTGESVHSFQFELVNAPISSSTTTTTTAKTSMTYTATFLWPTYMNGNGA